MVPSPLFKVKKGQWDRHTPIHTLPYTYTHTLTPKPDSSDPLSFTTEQSPPPSSSFFPSLLCTQEKKKKKGKEKLRSFTSLLSLSRPTYAPSAATVSSSHAFHSTTRFWAFRSEFLLEDFGVTSFLLFLLRSIKDFQNLCYIP